MLVKGVSMKVPLYSGFESIGSMTNYYSKLIKCGLNFHYANGHTKHEGNEIKIDQSYATSMTRVCNVLIPQDAAIHDRQYGWVCQWCADILDRERKQ
jgi:hypothetical protein